MDNVFTYYVENPDFTGKRKNIITGFYASNYFKNRKDAANEQEETETIYRSATPQGR